MASSEGSNEYPWKKRNIQDEVHNRRIVMKNLHRNYENPCNFVRHAKKE